MTSMLPNIYAPFLPFSICKQLVSNFFSIYNLTAHAQTDAIYNEYHYKSYIIPVVGCISHI